MRHTEENLVLVLDSMVDNPKLTVAARKIGVSPMSIYRWLRLSREGAENFPKKINWCGEVGSFHQFWEYAQHAQINDIEQTAKANATGFDEVVTHDGAIQYQIDSTLVGESDDPEVLEMLFNVRDKFLRIDGKVQPLTVKRKASDALVLRMLSSHKPEIYGERSTLNVNMKVGGVLRLQRPEEMPVKTLEQQSDGSFALDDVSAADDPDTKTSNMLALGRPALTSEEFDKWNADKEFAAEPVTFVKADGTRTTSGRPDTPLTRDLERRAAIPPAHPRPGGVVARDAAPAAPLPPTPGGVALHGGDHDARAEGIGHGRPAAGGFKTA